MILYHFTESSISVKYNYLFNNNLFIIVLEYVIFVYWFIYHTVLNCTKGFFLVWSV